jgi:hypothetical protein
MAPPCLTTSSSAITANSQSDKLRLPTLVIGAHCTAMGWSGIAPPSVKMSPRACAITTNNQLLAHLALA